MKRYFTFETPPDPAKYQPRGMYHYQSLEGGGYIAVAEEESMDIPPDWVELSHLLDPSPANFNGINTAPGAYVAPAATASTTSDVALAAIAGVTHTDAMFHVAMKIAKCNPKFRP